MIMLLMQFQIYGPDYDTLPLKWLPGPANDQNIAELLDMLIKDRFSECLEKYTCI